MPNWYDAAQAQYVARKAMFGKSQNSHDALKAAEEQIASTDWLAIAGFRKNKLEEWSQEARAFYAAQDALAEAISEEPSSAEVIPFPMQAAE